MEQRPFPEDNDNQGYPPVQGYYIGPSIGYFAQEGTAEWAQQRYPNVYAARPDYVLFLEGTKQDYDFDKAQAFHRKQFSVLAFFFSIFYFFYRKMWLEGVAYLVLNILVAMVPLVNSSAEMIVDIVLWLIAGFAFYPLWRRKAERTWQQQMQAYGGHLPSVVSGVRKQGGVSVLGLVISLVVYAIFMGLAFSAWMSGDVGSYVVGLGGTMSA